MENPAPSISSKYTHTSSRIAYSSKKQKSIARSDSSRISKPKPQISRTEEKKTGLKPQFISKEMFFGQNLESVLANLLEDTLDKEIFINHFRSLIAENPKIDFHTYQNAQSGFIPFGEKSFVNPINPYRMNQLSLNIIAVDGGLAVRQYSGTQITIIKAAVVSYNFNSGKPKISYYPLKDDNRSYCVYNDTLGKARQYGQALANIRRALVENSILIDYLENTEQNPDVIILDGSILPPRNPTIPLSDEFETTYTMCLQSYFWLYEYCSENNIHLLGSVKDTKISPLKELLLRIFPHLMKIHPNSLKEFHNLPYKPYLDLFTDTDFLNLLLNPKERSLAFQMDHDLIPFRTAFEEYFRDASRKVLQLENQRVYASYLKFSSHDLPLRIEFLALPKPSAIYQKIDFIAKVLYPISIINRECTLPLPQIEAHLRAGLQEQEAEIFIAHFERKFYLHYIKYQKELQRRLMDNRLLDQRYYKGDSNKSQETLQDFDYLSTKDNEQQESTKKILQIFQSKRHDRLENLAK